MQPVRWGVLGAGVISADFARGLRSARLGTLHAVGGRSADRAAEFAAEHEAPVSGTVEQILACDDVEAIYIGTVHTTHADLTLAALAAGKAVLCEKPMALTPQDCDRLTAAATTAQLPLLEAFKYRFGPMAAALRSVIENGEIGDLVSMRTGFGFPAPTRSGRLFDPAVAGGAIFDAGCYPASLAVGVASWAGIETSAHLSSTHGVIGPTGVDESATCRVEFGRFTAELETSIVQPVSPVTTIMGTTGRIEITNVWGSRTESHPGFEVHADGGVRRIDVSVVQPMAAEADAVALALRTGRLEVPEMTWRDSARTADLIATWRTAL